MYWSVSLRARAPRPPPLGGGFVGVRLEWVLSKWLSNKSTQAFKHWRCPTASISISLRISRAISKARLSTQCFPRKGQMELCVADVASMSCRREGAIVTSRLSIGASHCATQDDAIGNTCTVPAGANARLLRSAPIMTCQADWGARRMRMLSVSAARRRLLGPEAIILILALHKSTQRPHSHGFSFVVMLEVIGLQNVQACAAGRTTRCN